jgi:prevent-host-death family protein
MVMPMEVPVRELKNRLSEYLRRVGRGEEIVVTSHGKAVGRLVPPKKRRAAREDALTRLSALPYVRQGDGNKLRGAARRSTVAPGTSDEIMRWVRGG